MKYMMMIYKLIKRARLHMCDGTGCVSTHGRGILHYERTNKEYFSGTALFSTAGRC